MPTDEELDDMSANVDEVRNFTVPPSRYRILTLRILFQLAYLVTTDSAGVFDEELGDEELLDENGDALAGFCWSDTNEDLDGASSDEEEEEEEEEQGSSDESGPMAKRHRLS